MKAEDRVARTRLPSGISILGFVSLLIDVSSEMIRSLRLSAVADELTNLLAEAEANEMSYLSFADRLAEHELI
ncbi:hypothetical protein DET61_10920 [Marinobacter nauticus]|uniref:Uncharacterized protein n=1 Tax=Marinobacter nauticus TaxID=2743 RepID=A0A368XGI7_MARNT|nr:hypothetical protein DET61_10920 [Marinobacter nauticus]